MGLTVNRQTVKKVTVNRQKWHLCPEMHAMANLAILTKSCHSIDNDEFGEISSIFQKLNVS